MRVSVRMYLGKQSILIERAVEDVYRMAEKYPTFVRFFLEGSRILEESESSMKVRVRSRLPGGMQTSWEGTGVKVPHRFLRFQQTQGLLKGLVASWSFVPMDMGTKVTIMTRFTKRWLTPLGERLFGKYVVETTTQRILGELKAASENPVANAQHALTGPSAYYYSDNAQVR